MGRYRMGRYGWVWVLADPSLADPGLADSGLGYTGLGFTGLELLASVYWPGTGLGTTGL